MLLLVLWWTVLRATQCGCACDVPRSRTVWSEIAGEAPCARTCEKTSARRDSPVTRKAWETQQSAPQAPLNKMISGGPSPSRDQGLSLRPVRW